MDPGALGVHGSFTGPGALVVDDSRELFGALSFIGWKYGGSTVEVRGRTAEVRLKYKATLEGAGQKSLMQIVAYQTARLAQAVGCSRSVRRAQLQRCSCRTRPRSLPTALSGKTARSGSPVLSGIKARSRSTVPSLEPTRSTTHGALVEDGAFYSFGALHVPDSL